MDYNYCLRNILSKRLAKINSEFCLTYGDELRKRSRKDAINCCINKNQKQLRWLLDDARKRSREAFKLRDNYRYHRSFELEIEHVVKEMEGNLVFS